MTILKRVLTDPKAVLAVLAALAGGFLIGLYVPPVGEAMFPIGSIYIAFLIAVRPDAPNVPRWMNPCLANHVGMMEDEDIVRRYPAEETQAA